MTRWPPFFDWDVLAAGLLPADWERQLQISIQEDGMNTALVEEFEKSIETKDDYRFEVAVVTGDSCAARLPWLKQLYENELRNFASDAFGRSLFVAKDLKSSVNINCLRGIGARYGTHKDTNPVTGVLFACDANRDTGGELVFLHDGYPEAVVWPRKGIFIAFDAREIPHFVAPLKVEMDRISIPMNYYDHPTKQYRPEGLDEKLYTQQ